ncbi:CD209 antigen-like protein A isoform 2-T2 [Spinachia spinachia]
MFSNIYESVSMDRMYRRGQDGGQREERMVDIYDSVGTSPECHVSPVTAAANQRPPPDVQKKLLRAAVVVLVPLCALLGVGLVLLSTRPGSVKPVEHPPYEQLKAWYHRLSLGYCHQEVVENRTRGDLLEWSVFGCSCYYKSSEEKTWTESRADCRSRGTDLVMITSHEEQEFVSSLSKPETFWMGLWTARTQSSRWQWLWVDSNLISYQAWGVDVTRNNLSEGSRGYIGPEGTWNRTDGGTRRFICEKTIKSRIKT